MYIVSNYLNKFKYYIYEDLRSTGYPDRCSGDGYAKRFKTIEEAEEYVRKGHIYLKYDSPNFTIEEVIVKPVKNFTVEPEWI